MSTFDEEFELRNDPRAKASEIDAAGRSLAGLYEIVMYKKDAEHSLGVRFRSTPEVTDGGNFAIVERIAPGALSSWFLHEGDRVLTINGYQFEGPAEAASMLRSA